MGHEKGLAPRAEALGQKPGWQVHAVGSVTEARAWLTRAPTVDLLVTEAMKMAAAEGIASLIEEKELREDYVIPGAFDERVAEVVANAVARKAVEEGLSRI